jgi:hypothetical protein
MGQRHLERKTHGAEDMGERGRTADRHQTATQPPTDRQRRPRPHAGKDAATPGRTPPEKQSGGDARRRGGGAFGGVGEMKRGAWGISVNAMQSPLPTWLRVHPNRGQNP